MLGAYHDGAVITVRDVGTDPRFNEQARTGLRDRRVGAYVDTILFEEDQSVSLLAAQSATPRDWTLTEESVFRDVAERVKAALERTRAEAALRTSEEQFESLLNQAPLGVYLVDSDFVIRQVNPVALHVFGDIAGGPIGRDFDEIIHMLWDKKYADEIVSIFRHTLDTGESYVTTERAEYRVDRDITEYYEWRLDRILFAGGQYGVVCYFRDISPQVHARKEIEKGHELARKSEERYRTLFEAIDSGFCIIEMIFGEDGRATDYRFVEANPAFERQSGLVDAVGRRIREFAPDLEEHWLERYGRVALTGESMRVEGEVAQLGRWFDINAFRVGVPEDHRVAVLFTDISARRSAEDVLRESEERQAFLLKLSDSLRAEPSAQAVANRALQMMSAQMELDRCYVGIFRLEEDRAEIPYQVHDDRLPPLPAQIRLSDFPKALKIASDRTLVIDTVAEMEGLSDGDRANMEALGMRAFVAATLHKGENNPLWAIGAGSMHPRAWTQGEVSLVEEAAERIWAAVERAQAEAARVKADQRFTRLFEASPAPFLVLAPESPQFTITDVNEAYLTATMRTRKELLGRALFDAFPDNPNDPKSNGVSKLRASLEHVLDSHLPDQLPGLKYDIPRPDGTFEERWWSPVNSPILNDKGEVEAIIHNANDVTNEHRSDRHQRLLLAELQHRVRNILTMVRSIARRTADTCEDVDDYVRHLDGRLAYLARVQTILTRDPGRGVDLHEMVLEELDNQGALPAHFQIEGPDVKLAPKAAEVLTLAVHELATNSTKYGVLSGSTGAIRISWEIDDRAGQPWLSWTWREPVSPTSKAPGRTGFGSDLIKNRVPYELRGTGEFRIGDGEVKATIEFPVTKEAGMYEPSVHGRS